MRLPLITLLVLFGSPAYGQFNSGKTSETEALRLRAARESAVAHCRSSTAARNLVESDEFGDEAAKAILNCSRESGCRLAEFYESGGLSKCSKPKELLVLISKQGNADDIVAWIISHQSDLTDRDAVDAFLNEPMTFVLSLRKISTAAQERKAKRLEEPTESRWVLPKITESDRRGIFVIAVIVGFIWFLIWYRKRRSSDGPA